MIFILIYMNIHTYLCISKTTKFNQKKILFRLIEKTCVINTKRVVDLNSILFKNKSREKKNSLQQKSLSHEKCM